MNLKKLVTILIVGALAFAAGLGVFTYRAANAQQETPTATAPVETAPTDKDTAHPRFERGFGGYSNEDLANALGITVDQLTAAYQQAYKDGLSQAVQAGLITQAQADELLSRSSAAPFGGRWDGWLSKNGIDFNALLANALGISVEQLQAAYTTAFNARVDQAVANGNLTQEQADLMKGEYALRNNSGFQAAMQSAFEAAVQQAVTNGVITQAQADLILQNRSAKGFPGFGGFEGGRGHRGGPGRGGPGFPGDDLPANPTAPQSPTVSPSSGL